MIDNKLIISAIIAGIVWWFTYLYIRRYFNPENKYNIEKYRLDAYWGGVGAFFAVLISNFIKINLKI